MNYSSATSLLSSRQVDLHQQISKAKKLNNEKLLSIFEMKWVHRYGMKNLPQEGENINAFINDEFLENNEVICENHSELSKDFDDQPISNLDIQELDNFQQNEDDQTEENEILATKETVASQNNKKRFYSPPPSPTLSHLRRWLPSQKDEMPKAS